MEYDIKPKNLVRQEKGFPQTIQQLIQKYKLDALWENIEKMVQEIIEQNSGYVVKKDGVMYIADTNVLEEATVVLRIGKNFLDISNNGFEGDYQTIISLDGTINADFIKAGTMQADRIKGGTLTLGGDKNGNGEIDVQDSSGNTNVLINNNGITLSDGTKIIGGEGVCCNLHFSIPNPHTACGYWYRSDLAKAEQTYVTIYADIPKNFAVKSAYITIKHQPVSWILRNFASEELRGIVGNARNVQIYIDEFIPKEDVDFYGLLSTVKEVVPGEKTTALGKLGKTFSASEVETVVSEDLSEYLVPGQQTIFNIGSIDKASSIGAPDETYARTGYVIATLNVLGFLKT